MHLKKLLQIFLSCVFHQMRYLGFKMNSDLRLTASQVHVVDGSRRDLTAELEEHLLVPVGNNDRLDEYFMKGENA